jgi:SAM-dependent methyltransferase
MLSFRGITSVFLKVAVAVTAAGSPGALAMDNPPASNTPAPATPNAPVQVQPQVPPVPPTRQALVSVMRREGASIVEQLRAEAGAIMSKIECRSVRQILVSTNWLPIFSTRTVWINKVRADAVSDQEYNAMALPERDGYVAQEIDDEGYYYTKYGTPLAYARALDLACKALGCSECLKNRAVLDFGYGTIGHLRLLASNGVRVVGVDVDPLLKAIYSDPRDTGEIQGVGMSDPKPAAGSITLVHGQWPGSDESSSVRTSVGGDFDLIISKNTLKKGYVHPEREVEKHLLVDLGVTDELFVTQIARALKPGGLFLIYNISPKQREDKFLPWADGRSPFTPEQFAAAGLEVVEYNSDDTPVVRDLARGFEWDLGEQPIDIENDLFGMYTLVRKPLANSPQVSEPPKQSTP